MLCDICRKNEATVHLTEVINGDVSELHMCESCAREKSASMHQNFGMADFLSGLADIPLDMVSKKSHINIKCPACGMTYDNFKKMGRFGCAKCYDAFKRALYPLFKKIHGTSYHIGAVLQKQASIRSQKSANKPAAISAKDRLSDLKAMLLDAIKKEEFEQAAVLRDKIKAIEGKNMDIGRGKGKDKFEEKNK
jgi:protein arginine kinase activator